MAGKDLGALVGQIGADIRQWERAAKNIDRDLNRMQRKGVSAAKKMQMAFNRMSKSLTTVGRRMTRSVTLPLAAAAGGAVKMSADFESSFSKIEGLVGVAADEVDRMRQHVLGLGGETGQRPRELADALFFVTSAGLRGQEAMEVLEASAKAASAGLGETKVVADLVTSAVNAYGPGALSAAEATDVLVGAVREGKAEAPELAASLGQVLPVASQMGVSFDQVGAAVAAMTRTGTNAATASMQLRQILFKLLKPMTQSEEAARKMGTSTQAFRNMLRGPDGLVKVLGFLREQMKTNEQAMAEIFPNVRALAGALDLMGGNAEENIKIFERMKNTGGLLGKALDAVSDDMKFKFAQSLGDLEKAAIQFGDTMMPLAKQIVDFARDILQSINNMSEQSRKRLLKLAIIIGAAGPVAFAIGKLMAIVTTAAKVIAGAFTILTSPIGLIGIAIAGLIVIGKNLVDNWDVIAAELKNLWDGIKLAAVTIADAILQAFVGSLSGIVGAMMDAAAHFAPSMVPALAAVENGLMNLSDSSKEALQKTRAQFDASTRKVEGMRGNMVGLGESALSVWQGIKNVGSAALEATGIMDMFSFSLGGTAEQANKAATGIGNLLTEAARMGEFGGGIQMASLPTEEYEADLQSMKAATGQFVDSTKIALQGVETGWGSFVSTSKAAGFDFVNFMTGQVSGAIESFAVSIGNMLAGTGQEFATGLQKVLLLVIDFAKQLGKLLIGMGTAIAFIPGLQGPSGLYIAGGVALLSLATAAGGLIQRNIEGRKERHEARIENRSARTAVVNDALIRDDGSIVRLNPRDDILAMRDFSELGSVQPQRAADGMRGSGTERNFKKILKEGIMEGMREGRFNFPITEFKAAEHRYKRKENAVGNN